MYQPLHRKYRPKTFSTILGQEAIVVTLKNALHLNRIANAYLFCGSRGTGKTTLARLFAKALNCFNRTADQEPCNTCPSCLEINEARSLDVIEIDGASHRGIDDIRQINETIGYNTSLSKYKIYIIDEVHMLTKEAFNALLKTLEEPPENIKFFFATTEPHKILPTIISRCQRFDLNRIPTQQICQKLKTIAQELNLSIHDEVYELIATLSEGGLRDAESLLDQIVCYSQDTITYDMVTKILGLTPKSCLFKLDQAIYNQQLPFAFELTQEIFSTGKDPICFLDSLIEHFRFHLLYKLNIPITSYLSQEDRNSYLENSSFYTQEQCFYNLDFLMHWYKELSKIPFKRISLEMILLHLIRSKHRLSLPTLVRRLEALQTTPHAHLDTSSSDSTQIVTKTADLTSQESPITPIIQQEPIVIKETVIVSEPATSTPESSLSSHRHDVLLKFAAIELEGTLTKD